ncbi:CDP-alcohol phosphatidyltransferase family protein [Shewanella gelidii]|uniref:CDP-alcohol phosphatidyltransferase n=1 Tax=Shewanella gelidii TaxID=1642821 RepID=A0A917NBF1_9GAMM|nr:CDP-alcohol phosphatidyltransferase family protein [Shewanella gelidii]MCL1098312.1 CDP-alcohol phosphatidyltransferase family protein [Shewanella gelidii]GGI84292.1 CDP-alcohol phosphatidyltransferase [Shewanella gelidii]
MTLYELKPKFQSLLRPFVRWLEQKGVSANQVTILAVLGSVLLGSMLMIYSETHALFLLLPLWMFVRMALNAIDGMLAREFNQQSNLGAYLNELSDVVADAALFLPFALISPFTPLTVAIVIFLATLSEFAGLQGITIGASRRYDGPLGKSDRAFIFGAIGLWIGLGGVMPSWLFWLMPTLALLICLTVFNRVKRALQESNELQAASPLNKHD